MRASLTLYWERKTHWSDITCLDKSWGYRSSEGKKVGYIRLIVFSKNAAKDVGSALQDLSAEGVDSIILDLRDNIGGVIFSGYEAEILFLPSLSDCRSS